MRTAVISDIHANIEALTAVLEKIGTLGVDEVICLGDMVGYNANPNECLDLLRDQKITCLLGNHDAVASGLEEPDNFNTLARSAILWTREHLSDENRSYLLTLKREQRIRDFFAFHGSIHDTDRYILYRDDALFNFHELAKLPEALMLGFFGHTHIRVVLSMGLGIISASLMNGELELASDQVYLINPGSVGQPRDGDPRAAFLEYDEQARTVTFHRVEYAIGRSQEKIILAGLPPQLAERLARGM